MGSFVSPALGQLRSSARCPLCASFLVPLFDPYARETLGCPNPACRVTDDPSSWLNFEE